MTYQTAASDSVDRGTYTFAAQPIGTASASRLVVVSVVSRGSPAVLSVTVGGVSATLRVNNDTAAQDAAIWDAVVPTGTTADIVVTYNGSALRCGIGVWTLDGYTYTGESDTATGATPHNLTVTTAAGQEVIAVGAWRSTTTSDATWTGASERFDAGVDGFTSRQTGGDTVATGSSTSIDLAVTNLNASEFASAAAAYAPPSAPIEGAFQVDVVTAQSFDPLATREASVTVPVVSTTSAAPLAQRRGSATIPVVSTASMAPLAQRQAAMTVAAITGQSFTAADPYAAMTVAAVTGQSFAPLAQRIAQAIVTATSTTSMAPLARRVASVNTPVVSGVALAPLATRLASGTVVVVSGQMFAPIVPPRSAKLYYRGTLIERAYHQGDEVAVR